MNLRHALAALLIAVPSLAHATTPQAGVEQNIRHGFFVETDLGTYFDFRTSPFTSSNAQPYLQLGVGYDITDRLSVAIQFGLGANASLCFVGQDANGDCALTDSNGNVIPDPNTGLPQIMPDNFSNTFIQAQVAYAFPIIDRLAFVPRLEVGYQQISPAPLLDSNNNPITGGVMVGTDLSVEYATHQDHFFVGLNVEPRFLIGPNIISMAIFPRVKYTF
jgi:hypothetical protein